MRKHPKPEKGIEVRHSKTCRSRQGGGCNCQPSYRGHVWDARTERRVRGPFYSTVTQARNWRHEALVATRRGTLRPPSPTTVQQAADALLDGMRDGTVLNRAGRPYKPSSIRSYEHALRHVILPALGPTRLSALKRRDVQRLVDRLHADGASPSTVHNKLDPLRVICRRARRDDELAVDATDGLELPALRGARDRIEAPMLFAHCDREPTVGDDAPTSSSARADVLFVDTPALVGCRPFGVAASSVRHGDLRPATRA
jgi:integrase